MYNSVQIQDEDVNNDEIELVFNPVFNQDLIISGIPEVNVVKGTNIALWSSCYINLTSTCIGAGIIGIPYAFSKSGWVLGTCLILISGSLSYFGAHLLSLCAAKSKVYPSSFWTVANACIPNYSFIVDYCIAIKCFGVTTSYLFIIGDSLPLAMEQLNAPHTLQNRSVCIILAFLLIAPISFLPSLDALKFTSWLSAGMLIYLVLLIFLYALHIPNDTFDPCYQFDYNTVTNTDNTNATTNNVCKGTQELFIFNTETIKILSVFIFNFSCQQNVFTIVNELKTPTQSRLNSVFFGTMLTATVLYIIVTYSAYSTFGNVMLTDIVKMYPKTPLTTLCRILVSLIVAMHFPLQLNPARKSLLSLVKYYNNDANKITISERVLTLRFGIVTTLHLLLNLITALSFTDLGVTFQLCGATGSTMVIFVLPGLFYYLLHKHDTLTTTSTSTSTRSERGSVPHSRSRRGSASSVQGSDIVEDISLHNHSDANSDTFNSLPTHDIDIILEALEENSSLSSNGSCDSVTLSPRRRQSLQTQSRSSNSRRPSINPNNNNLDENTANINITNSVNNNTNTLNNINSTINIENTSPKWKLYASLCMLSFGAVIGPLCVVLIIIQSVSESGGGGGSAE